MLNRPVKRENHDSHITCQYLFNIETRLNSGVRFDSADDYYWHKDRARQLAAKLSCMTERQYDPMGVWHSMQSN